MGWSEAPASEPQRSKPTCWARRGNCLHVSERPDCSGQAELLHRPPDRSCGSLNHQVLWCQVSHSLHLFIFARAQASLRKGVLPR